MWNGNAKLVLMVIERLLRGSLQQLIGAFSDDLSQANKQCVGPEDSRLVGKKKIKKTVYQSEFAWQICLFRKNTNSVRIRSQLVTRLLNQQRTDQYWQTFALNSATFEAVLEFGKLWIRRNRKASRIFAENKVHPINNLNNRRSTWWTDVLQSTLSTRQGKLNLETVSSLSELFEFKKKCHFDSKTSGYQKDCNLQPLSSGSRGIVVTNLLKLWVIIRMKPQIVYPFNTVNLAEI